MCLRLIDCIFAFCTREGCGIHNHKLSLKGLHPSYLAFPSSFKSLPVPSQWTHHPWTFSLVVVAVSGLFFAGVIKGATGIGYSSCALPFLVVSLGLKEAIVLVVAPAIASNVSVLFTTGRVGRSLKQFWPFYLATLPGIFCGVLLLTAADKRVPTQILGVVICAYAILALLRPSLALTPAAARRLRAPAGFLNGLLTGFTGSQVMPLMPYMLALHLEPALLVQAVNVAVVIATVFLGAGLWMHGRDVGAGFEPVHPGGGAGASWRSAWKLGAAAHSGAAVQIHRAGGAFDDWHVVDAASLGLDRAWASRQVRA